MDELVGQQQLLVSKLGQEELKEPQKEESGGQDSKTEGVPGGVLEDELEDVPGNEPGNSVEAKDGIGEEALKRDKGKAKKRPFKLPDPSYT
ncbi:hypothetical protein ID866_12053 [Astraeus odoratus]|nr:hypothetical protein ID866_12053 [Astraeus odoratus]